MANDHLDINEKEFNILLRDLEEKETEELRRWNKMKRFEKIVQLRQEQGFLTE